MGGKMYQWCKLVLIVFLYGIVPPVNAKDCSDVYLTALQQHGIVGLKSFFKTSNAEIKLSEMERITGRVTDLFTGSGMAWNNFYRNSVTAEGLSHYSYLGHDLHGTSEKLGRIRLHLAQPSIDDCSLDAVHMDFQN